MACRSAGLGRRHSNSGTSSSGLGDLWEGVSETFVRLPSGGLGGLKGGVLVGSLAVVVAGGQHQGWGCRVACALLVRRACIFRSHGVRHPCVPLR